MNRTIYVYSFALLSSLLAVFFIPVASYGQEIPAINAVFIAPDLESYWHRADYGLPEDTNIRLLASSDKEVFLGTAQHGIYKTVSPVLGWQPINNGLPKHSEVDALMAHEGRLFAGFFKKGLYISDDGGKNWRASNAGLDDVSVRSLLNYGKTLFTGTHDGLYRSDDNGDSWVAVKKGIQVNEIIQHKSELYVATNKGILHSTDSGKQWNWIAENGAVGAIAATDRYLFSNSLAHRTGASKMELGSKKWQTIFFPPSWKPASFPSRFFSIEGKVVVGQDNKLLLSTDGGVTWQINELPIGPNMLFTRIVKTPFGMIAVAKPWEPGC